MMKYNTVLFLMMVCVLCTASCGKGKGKDSANAADSQSAAAVESPIFAQGILDGVSENLDAYRDLEGFTVDEVVVDPREMGKDAPDHYMAAENDEIIIGFWPDDDGGTSYRLKFIDIKKKTGSWFLGQFIGMTPEELFDRFTRPGDYEESGKGENHIVYFSADGKKMVNFWLEDNVVIRAAFGYM